METRNPIFQDNHFVGYVKQVSPRYVVVHFPSSPLLKKFYWNAEGLQAGIVGNYILIEGEDHGFLGQITELSLPEKERMNLNQTAFERDDFHPFAKVEILLSFNFYELKADKGLSQLPPIGSKVFVCPSKVLMSFLKEFGKNKQYAKEPGFEFSSLPHHPGMSISISPQAIFGRHCAIVGSTGGGKSYTVSKLIEEIIRNNGKTILFDPTGEYKTLSKNKAVDYYQLNSSEANNICFHSTHMSESDFYAMFRPAGQIQLPKLQEAFKSLRLVKKIKSKSAADYTKVDKDLIAGNYISENGLLSKAYKLRKTLLSAYAEYPDVDNFSCDFDITKIGYQVYTECVHEMDFNNADNFGKSNERDLGLCFSLITRINTIIQNSSFINIFGIGKEPNDPSTFFNIYQKFVDKKSKKNVLIIGLDKVPTEHNLKSIVVNAFGRFFLDQAIELKFKKSPIIIFLDEAHQFLNQKIKDEYSIEVQLNSFERIAKECRKYGLFLALATQMPRDIPAGILSQFGTFIVHRLINQRDRETIEYACSEATKSSLSFLPILTPGQALITGVDFPMPVILQIDRPNLEPDSKTPRIFSS